MGLPAASVVVGLPRTAGRPLRVLAIGPQQSPDTVARAHIALLPPLRRVLGGLGALRNGAAQPASHLLFEPGSRSRR